MDKITMETVGLVFIALVCLVVILSPLMNRRAYPFILYGIGSGMVLMTTLAGPALIGNDIHLEYYYALLNRGVEVLPPTYGIPQGTSIVNTLIPVILPWNMLITFKVIYPLLFAFVPVIIYFIFRKFFNAKRAFLASFLFIIFPAYSMELPGVVRQMVSEVVFAGVLFLLIFSKWNKRIKIPLIITCGILLPLMHYSIAFTAIIILSIALIIKNSRRSLVVILIATIIITSCIYFPNVEHGAVVIKLAYIWNNLAPDFLVIPSPNLTTPSWPYPEWAEQPPVISRVYEGLIYSGLGLDFFSTTILGKVFRALQWVIMVLCIIGLWKLRKKKAYWVFAGGGLLLIVFQLIPGFSSLLNVTRFLHIALIILAPIGVVALKPKYMVFILVAYFLFTSGFVFEVAKVNNIEYPNIPYNVGLSDYRMDLGASITQDDKDMIQYIVKNKLFPVAGDTFGASFIGEYVGWRDDLHVAFTRGSFKVHDVYVFIRSRNMKDGTFTVWNGIGCKKAVDPMEHYQIDINQNIIKQIGDARLIWVP